MSIRNDEVFKKALKDEKINLDIIEYSISLIHDKDKRYLFLDTFNKNIIGYLARFFNLKDFHNKEKNILQILKFLEKSEKR